MNDQRQLEDAIDVERDRCEQIVLDALSEMFPDFDFSACYDVGDLMRHASGQLAQLREVEARNAQLESSHPDSGYAMWTARAMEAEARVEKLREALQKIARGPFDPPDEPWSKAEAIIALGSVAVPATTLDTEETK